MNYTIEELITYRINKAKESLDEAVLLAQSNHWNTVANRLYYASFYAINALFVRFKIQSTTHSGVKANFHKEFIKTKKVDLKYGKLYNNLFNKKARRGLSGFSIF